MSLCLYECLRAVGLQGHYTRFTSVGVCRAAHLSALSMEDYPILGIRSMEDRTRLFNLVQMVKTLDLEYEDGDDYYDVNDEDYAVADDTFSYDDEDEKGAAVNATSFSGPSLVRRQLDFSSERIDHHVKLFSPPEDTVHASTEPGRGKGSAIPLQLDTGGALCGCKGKRNQRPDVCESDHHTAANTEPNIMQGDSMYSSATKLSPKFVSLCKLNNRPAPVASNSFRNKPVGCKDRKGISRKDKLCTGISSNTATENKPTPVYESKRTAGYNYGLPLSSPPAPNKKQTVGQRISVCVRKRPLTRTECRRGEADVVTTPSGECVIVHESKEAVDLTQYILQHRFYFDQVFGEERSNEEVYQRTAYPLVQHMLNGGKATCFAYGQTGAGKTHTMLGSSSMRPGLYALAVRDIFAALSATHTHSALLVYVSFFEIYCGQLYDLLDHRKRLFAREDGQKMVHIVGLHDVRVDSVSSLMEVISQGTEERTQGVSGVNPLSSRSHAVLQIQLRDPNQQIAGRMWFVDLAGSERASDTKEPDRQSRMEGAEINQSLLALKECIRSLDQEQLHTPFRQSKLTQVLKDSFVGDSMTCMIANISPGHLATEHTLNTLRYADRVKELRGQGGHRGGKKGKTIPSPKHNLFKSSSRSHSAGTRGKSPPKRPKLGRQREDFGPTTPTSRLAGGGDAFLCSTPKNSRWGEETSARTRKEIGLEHVTPVKGLLGISEKVEKAGGREGGRKRCVVADSAGRSAGDQNVAAKLVLGQTTDKLLQMWEVQRKSGLYHRENKNQQSTLKEGGQEGRRRTEQRRQVEISKDTCSEVRERDLQKVDERDTERERHLRLYHQQLQQFLPSPASSSVHLLSPSTCPPFSSSNQASLSSSVSPSCCSSLQHSSGFSVSALMYQGLENVLDTYRAKVEVNGKRGQSSVFPCGAETTLSCNRNNDELSHGDSGGVSKDWSEGTGERFGGKSEKRRSLKETGEGEVRREEWRPAGVDRRGERRWAWVATTETKQADRMTGAMPADVEALMSNNCDSKERREVGEEGLDASVVTADGVWSHEEREAAEGYSLLSNHSDSDSLFNRPPFESSHQKAPAERPLSPACEHTNPLLTPKKPSDPPFKLKHTRCTSNILHLPLQNAQQEVPPSSCREKPTLFAAHDNREEFAPSATLPFTTAITQNACKIPAETLNKLSESPSYTQVHHHQVNHPDVKAKMSVLCREESADSLSCIMDPLSVSLLQVDQQVATDSFLRGKQNTSLCSLERRKDNRKNGEEGHRKCEEMARKDVVEEDVEFRLSLLELPQAKTQRSPVSDTMTATNHTKQRKDMCCTLDKYCEIGMMKPLIPEVMLDPFYKKDNQKPQTTPTEVLGNMTSASPLKPSICSSMQNSVMQSGNTGSPSSHNLMSNGSNHTPQGYAHNKHNKFASSTSTLQSESILGQLNTVPKQGHTVHSNHSSNTDISSQPTDSNSEESNSSQQISPVIHLSALEDLDHGQWRIVQAHWEQLEEMEALFYKEGTLLCQQPEMAFGEYVHKLEDIMERKARCVHSMLAQLRPYLKPSHSNQPHNQEGDNHHPIT